MSDAHQTTVDEINDTVLRGIAEAIEAGRCWACDCEAGTPHAPHCPEVADAN